ncbi:AmmeMemoRadiSam system protein A [Coprothermobacter platensis]|uniref:AmmeMemoRadiSam system protein A n=1 Tax=Coprothermobacter platensis TaxID=108819 RepID=UPI00036FEDC9|nr:AmmeMemoRadiSam system protein A [Coprothermobacter platensis]
MMNNDKEQHHPFVMLAKQALETFVMRGVVITPPNPLPEEFRRKAGCFVTLEENGELRGCIGTIEPIYDNLAQEIINNAIAAGTEDPRFPPVTVDELDIIDYTVEVLSSLEEVADESALDPKRWGVVVQSKLRPYRKGVLLPNLEGVDSVQEQIRICRLKGGISHSEEVRLFRFTTEKYK